MNTNSEVISSVCRLPFAVMLINSLLCGLCDTEFTYMRPAVAKKRNPKTFSWLSNSVVAK